MHADEGEDQDEESHADGEPHDEEEAPEVAVEPEEGEEVADLDGDEDEGMHQEEEDADEEEEAPEVEGVIEIDGVKYAPVVSEEEDEDEGMYECEHGEEDEDEGNYMEDLDLEAVLAELEGETVNEEEDEDEEVKEEEEKEVDEEVNENDVSSEIGAADNKLKPEAGDSSKIGQGPEGEGKDKESGKEDDNLEVVDDLTEDLDLEEVLKALTEGDDEDDEEKKEESVEEINSLKADIEEHRNVVKYLRGKLNEVNLLNAKLLFTNKLFRNFGLNNEQKLKVVETFDRATNLREVKLVFSTLAESFGNKVASKPSKPIKESKGSSSKPVASTKPKTEEVISEGFDLKERFQKLAKIL